MSVDIEVEQMPGVPLGDTWAASGVHARFLDFWGEHADPEGWVPKTVVSPFALKPILPSLVLLQRTPGDDWRFTLIGTGVVNGYGVDFSGTCLSECSYSPCRNVFKSMIDVCVATVSPQICFGRMRYPGREFLDTIKTVLPISVDGTGVSHCLFALSVEKLPARFTNFYAPTPPEEGYDKQYTLMGRGPGFANGVWQLAHTSNIHTVS